MKDLHFDSSGGLVEHHAFHVMPFYRADRFRKGKERRPLSESSIVKALSPHPALALLGYGLIYAWGICLWNEPTLGTFLVESQGTQSLVWLIQAASAPIACAAIALWGTRADLPDTKGVIWLCAVLMSGSTLLAPLALSSSSLVLKTFAGILTGILPIVLLVSWTRTFARVDSETMESMLPFSFLITFIAAVIIPNLPFGLSLAFCALLPLLSAAALRFAQEAISDGSLEGFDDESVLATGNPVRASAIVSVSLVVFLMEGTMGLLAYLVPSIPEDLSRIASCAGIVAAIALSYGIIVFSRRLSIRSLYRAMSIPFVIAVLFAPIHGTWAAATSLVAQSAVSLSIEMLATVYFIALAHRSSLNVTFCAAIGLTATYLPLLIAGMAGPTVSHLTSEGYAGPAFACLCCACAYAIANVAVVWNEGEPHAALVRRRSDAAEPSLVTECGDESDGIREMTLDEACALIGGESSLTPRETEIFAYLARGRSEPYIRDALVLSRNTVSSHVRHIYRKIDVHSKQELIEMVETRRVEQGSKKA